jgi:hypothetical protein
MTKPRADQFKNIDPATRDFVRACVAESEDAILKAIDRNHEKLLKLLTATNDQTADLIITVAEINKKASRPQRGRQRGAL